MIRLEKNHAKMIRWMCNFRPEDKISAEELRTKLKWNSLREYLLDRETKMVWSSRKNGRECLV